LKIKEFPLIYQDYLELISGYLRPVMTNQISILFVDDHPLIRKAWDFLLRQDKRFKVIGVCESGEEAIVLTKQLCPDIVIMDIRLRGISGIEATQLIKQNCPEVKIIGLSFHLETDYAEKIMKNGARGYLSKNSSPDEIFTAITKVQSGGSYICQEIF
jgi:two-component system invasion response regulator UvrY